MVPATCTSPSNPRKLTAKWNRRLHLGPPTTSIESKFCAAQVKKRLNGERLAIIVTRPARHRHNRRHVCSSVEFSTGCTLSKNQCRAALSLLPGPTREAFAHLHAR